MLRRVVIRGDVLRCLSFFNELWSLVIVMIFGIVSPVVAASFVTMVWELRIRFFGVVRWLLVIFVVIVIVVVVIVIVVVVVVIVAIVVVVVIVVFTALIVT